MSDEESDAGESAIVKFPNIKSLDSGSFAHDAEVMVRSPWRPPKRLEPLDERLEKNPLMKSMKKDTWIRKSWSDGHLRSRRNAEAMPSDDRSSYLGASASPSRFSSFAMKRETGPPSAIPPGLKTSYHKNVAYPEMKKDRYLELFGAEVDYVKGRFLKLQSSEGGATMPTVEHKKPAPVFVRDRTRQLTMGLGPPYVEHGYCAPPANLSEVGLAGSLSMSSKFLSHSYGRLYKHLAETFYAEDVPAPKTFKRARNLLGPQTCIRSYDHLNNPVETKPRVLFKGVTVIRPPTPPPPPPPPPPTLEEWEAAQAKGPGTLTSSKRKKLSERQASV